MFSFFYLYFGGSAGCFPLSVPKVTVAGILVFSFVSVLVELVVP